MLNGNIYNKKDLKESLLSNDFILDSSSDAEMLLKSYIHYGKDVVYHLNGVYSFIIWDSQKNEVFLARDHFGVKHFFIPF